MNKTLIFAVGAVALMACYVGISFYVKRYVKSVADFWVMGRQAKWWMFTGTLCATYVSMWTFLAGVGLAWGWGPLSPMLFYTSSLTFGWIIATVLLGLRLRRMQCNSVTEFFEKRFGTNPGYFYTGLSIALAGSLFFYLLLQIQGTGIILSTIFSLPMSVSILIIVVILIISLDAAGMWSVVASDTFSCLIFIIVAIFVLPITISSVGGLETGIAAVNAQNLWSATGASKLNMTYFLGYALSWLAIVGGSPHIINRSLVVDTPKSVLKGTFVGYILTIILTVVLFLSGSLLVAKIAPKAMPVDSIAPFAALNIWPLWLGILIIVGAVGAAYTTANTQAMTIAQSIVDFYRFSVNKTATDKKLLNITRLACVVVLIVTGLVAMKKFWILAIASSLAGIIFSLGFFPVLVLSLYWKKVTRTATNIMLWASVPIGAFMILTNYFYKWFAPFPTIYSFPIGFGGLILLSYLTKPSQEEQDAYDKMQNIAFGSGGEKIVAAKSDYVTLGLGFAVIIVAAVILVSIFS